MMLCGDESLGAIRCTDTAREARFGAREKIEVGRIRNPELDVRWLEGVSGKGIETASRGT